MSQENESVKRVTDEVTTFEVAITKLAMLLSKYYNNNHQHMPEEVRIHFNRAVTQASWMQSEMIQASRNMLKFKDPQIGE